jgi:hypothetical protein
METSASFEAWSAPSPYPAILGRAMETSASCEARYAPWLYPTSGMGQNWPLEKPSASIANVRLKRARAFSQVMTAVSSTRWRSEKCVRSAEYSSSETFAGVRVSAVTRDRNEHSLRSAPNPEAVAR